MNTFLQSTYKITLANLRNIPFRLSQAFVVIVGTACVVGILVGLMSIGGGIERALGDIAQPGRVIFLSGNAGHEASSSIGRSDWLVIDSLEGLNTIAKELYSMTESKQKFTDFVENLPVRGVENNSFELRSEVKVISGRSFNPGSLEVIVGTRAVELYNDLDIGDEILLREGFPAHVVGHFSSKGSAYEGEVWMDLNTALSVFRRSTISSIRAKLSKENDIDGLRTHLAKNPKLGLGVWTEKEIYERQSGLQTRPIKLFGYAISFVAAIGAALAALGSMHHVVEVRRNEYSILRALGFTGPMIAIAIISESIALSLVGATLGSLCAYVLLDGQSILLGYRPVAFDLTVSVDAVMTGALWAMALGIAGGIIPAVNAAQGSFRRI